MTELWLSASEAQVRLNVRPQTLYAYVSRGLIEAQASPDGGRRSLYRAADVDRLAQRKARGRRVADVAAGAIAWGEPVLDSAVSTVVRGRLFYRGQDAVQLAEAASLEDVAALLWDGPLALVSDVGPFGDEASMKARVFAWLAAQAAADPPSAGRAKALLLNDATTLVSGVIGSLAGAGSDAPAHVRLARAWGCDARGADQIRRALVLLADHELNASTFACRVAASTGASLSAACLAGLAALSGPRHGGHFARVQAFLAEVRNVGAEQAVQARLTQGVSIPGFGHPLYSEGDPRASALLGSLGAVPEAEQTAETVVRLTGALPNIDYALCATAEALDLPAEAPFALFCGARCVGWIAHALEQWESKLLIRPRARYVGLTP